jgi:hypothetical protein
VDIERLLKAKRRDFCGSGCFSDRGSGCGRYRTTAISAESRGRCLKSREDELLLSVMKLLTVLGGAEMSVSQFVQQRNFVPAMQTPHTTRAFPLYHV